MRETIASRQESAAQRSLAVRSDCRICHSNKLEVVLDLGAQPLANAFLADKGGSGAEERYPLEFCRCAQCGHAQLSVTVSPEVMFRNYPYASGTSETIPAHFSEYANQIQHRFVPDGGLVVEIGSNDGTLLKAFDQKRLRVLGVEPASNIATIAAGAGIPTINDFFSETLAKGLAREYGLADAIIANNVVAHINDLHGLFRGVAALLAPTGVFVAEFPYLVDLLERTEYDTIYHEHLSYFSVRATRNLAERFGLALIDVQRVGVHGGSLKVFVGRGRERSASVDELLRFEEELMLQRAGPFERFARRSLAQRDRLRELLTDLRGKGRRIAAYGAAAKGNTLLNFCGIDYETIDFVCDRSELKHGLYTPGSHIPVVPVETLLARQPEVTLLLAWNFADEILRQQQAYRRAGGRFIVPIPDPTVV